jgi:hypothetical protein
MRHQHSRGPGALANAAENGDLYTVESMVSKSTANVNETGTDDMPALMSACQPNRTTRTGGGRSVKFFEFEV